MAGVTKYQKALGRREARVFFLFLETVERGSLG